MKDRLIKQQPNLPEHQIAFLTREMRAWFSAVLSRTKNKEDKWIAIKAHMTEDGQPLSSNGQRAISLLRLCYYLRHRLNETTDCPEFTRPVLLALPWGDTQILYYFKTIGTPTVPEAQQALNDYHDLKQYIELLPLVASKANMIHLKKIIEGDTIKTLDDLKALDLSSFVGTLQIKKTLHADQHAAGELIAAIVQPMFADIQAQVDLLLNTVDIQAGRTISSQQYRELDTCYKVWWKKNCAEYHAYLAREKETQEAAKLMQCLHLSDDNRKMLADKLREHPEHYLMNEREQAILSESQHFASSYSTKIVFHLFCNASPAEWSPELVNLFKAMLEHTRPRPIFQHYQYVQLYAQMQFLVECYDAIQHKAVSVITAWPTFYFLPYMKLKLPIFVLEKWQEQDTLPMTSLLVLHRDADPSIQPFILDWIDKKMASERYRSFTFENLKAVYLMLDAPLKACLLKHFGEEVRAEPQLLWLLQHTQDQEARIALINNNVRIMLKSHSLRNIISFAAEHEAKCWTMLFSHMKTGMHLENVLRALTDAPSQQAALLRSHGHLALTSVPAFSKVLGALNNKADHIFLIDMLANNMTNAFQATLYVNVTPSDYQLYLANRLSFLIKTQEDFAHFIMVIRSDEDKLTFVMTHKHLLADFGVMLYVAQVLPSEYLIDVAKACPQVFFGHTFGELKPFTDRLPPADVSDFFGDIFEDCRLEPPVKRAVLEDRAPVATQEGDLTVRDVEDDEDADPSVTLGKRR